MLAMKRVKTMTCSGINSFAHKPSSSELRVKLRINQAVQGAGFRYKFDSCMHLFLMRYRAFSLVHPNSNSRAAVFGLKPRYISARTTLSGALIPFG